MAEITIVVPMILFWGFFVLVALDIGLKIWQFILKRKIDKLKKEPPCPES